MSSRSLPADTAWSSARTVGDANRQHRQVVVVTGGTAGIGRATVREFARHGARVAILARGRDRLEATAREVEQLGGEGLALEVDVANWPEVERAAAAVESQLGPIDVWVNNAMVSVFSPVTQTTAEEYRRVTEVTYLGYVHGSLAALHHMTPRNRGCIVQVGSALAFRGIPLQSAYCGAKHAVEGFTESLRCELMHEQSGVRVTEVHLPAINTTQFGWVRSKLPRKPQPVPPIYEPEVAARAIFWAAHQKRRALLFGWPTFAAIWADKLAPGLVDRYLAAGGYDSQQTSESADPDRPDNLFEPVAGAFEAHGTFSGAAKPTSLSLSLMTQRSRTYAVLASCLAAAVGWGIWGRGSTSGRSGGNP